MEVPEEVPGHGGTGLVRHGWTRIDTDNRKRNAEVVWNHEWIRMKHESMYLGLSSPSSVDEGS